MKVCGIERENYENILVRRNTISSNEIKYWERKLFSGRERERKKIESKREMKELLGKKMDNEH